MTPLDDLPAEQRAVLELVLKRGRSYDEIAGLLSIDRARVRQRALAGFDALGPSTGVPAERRALITDYLLGQLPAAISEQVARRLASEPSERAWARVIASEVGPVAAAPLPAIPAGGAPEESALHPGVASPAAAEEAAAQEAAGAAARGADPGARRSGYVHGDDQPPSSRRGGAILLGGGALLAVIVVVAILLLSGGSDKSPTTAAGASSVPTTTTPSTSGTTTRTGTTPTSLATVRLTPPTKTSKAQGVAEAFAQSGKIYLALVALNLAANSHNFYAVWLSNGGSDSRLIGFSPPVTSNGRLQAAGNLKASDSHYKQLLLTLETSAHPTTPGTTVLSGAFTLRSP